MTSKLPGGIKGKVEGRLTVEIEPNLQDKKTVGEVHKILYIIKEG